MSSTIVKKGKEMKAKLKGKEVTIVGPLKAAEVVVNSPPTHVLVREGKKETYRVKISDLTDIVEGTVEAGPVSFKPFPKLPPVDKSAPVGKVPPMKVPEVKKVK